MKRETRFSVPLTVFLATILPALVGFILGGVFFLHYVVTHIGTELHLMEMAQVWLLTIMHGLVMYGIVSLVFGIVTVFLIDRGITQKGRIILSIIAAVVTLVWAEFTVEFTGDLSVIFISAAIACYWFIGFVTVPSEKRVAPKLFG